MRIGRLTMRRRKWTSCIPAASITLLAASASVGQEGAVTVRTPDATSQIITGHVDEAVVVELESQPGTGYVWSIVNSVPGLEFLGSDTASLPGSSPGRGAVQSFRFKPVIAGEFRLDFVLQRPWERDPIDRRIVRIRASE
jgi:predicted secreted protein